MIKDFNEFYVEAGIVVTSEQLSQRWKGIENFCEELNSDDICDLIKIIYGFTYDKDFYARFVEYFIDIDPNFSISYTEEIKLLAGVVLVNIAENFELGYLIELLVKTNSFYHVLPSHLVQTRIIKQFDIDRINLRTSKEIKDNSIVQLQKLKKCLENDDENWSTELIKMLKEEHDYNKNLLNVLNIYKEDSQMLWWLNSQWSNTLDCSIKNLTKNQLCILIGFEAAEIVENYPGPFSIDAILKSLVKEGKGNKTKIGIDKVLESADYNWKKKIVSNCSKNPFLELLPIHSAIQREDSTNSLEQWYPKYKKEILQGQDFENIAQDEYPFRMFLETLAIKLYSKLNNKGEK